MGEKDELYCVFALHTVLLPLGPLQFLFKSLHRILHIHLKIDVFIIDASDPTPFASPQSIC